MELILRVPLERRDVETTEAMNDRGHLRSQVYRRGAVSDEAKSVTRQIEHARVYAIRKGWTVDDAQIYVDDGISGAEF